MPDILSQNEINDLLRSLAENDELKVSAKSHPFEVKDYDFRTANRFSKDNMRTFSTVFEYFSRLLVTYLSGSLRTECEASVESVEEIVFGDFAGTVASPVVLGVVNMTPDKRQVLFRMPSALAYAIVNRMFGGSANLNIEATSDSGKEFSEIDLFILERVFQQIMGIFSSSWEKVEPFDSSLERIETSIQFAQIVPYNEPSALVAINLRIGQTGGVLHFCIPYVSIQSIVKKLNSMSWYSGKRFSDSLYRDELTGKLKNAPVTVRIMFNDTSATIGDVLSLQVGDVIKLNHTVRDLLTVCVEDVPKYKGQVGTHASKFALQISERIKEEGADE